MPLVLLQEAPCGWGHPDDDEPANNLWESATSYRYGLYTGRTFWDPNRPAGSEWDDMDWYEWEVSWTGFHWIWVQNLDPANLRVILLVYEATEDVTLGPLDLLAWGESYVQGDLRVGLEGGTTYYVQVINLSGEVGCYDLWLDP